MNTSRYGSHRSGGSALVVVQPLDRRADRSSRQVDILGLEVGRASSTEDLERLIRRAGLPDLETTDLGQVEWRGQEADVWD